MNYVEVPVPDDLVDKVAAFLRAKQRPAQPPSDPDAVGRVYRGLERSLRRMLDLIATDRRHGEFTTVPLLAERLSASPREVVGMMLEINSAMTVAGGPSYTLFPMEVPGSDAVTDRMLIMAEDVANAIFSAGGGA
jgi:hypothetical protein